jgi:hypothetical protein
VIVLVTGSRHAEDSALVRDYIRQAFAWTLTVPHATKDRHELWHGAARGIDTIAADIATACGWIVRAFPADWDRLGKAAGPIRNQHMVAELAASGERAICVAFPRRPESRGTEDCIVRAWRAGIPTVIFPLVPTTTASISRPAAVRAPDRYHSDGGPGLHPGGVIVP